MRVGVLAVQGNFEAHAQRLQSLGMDCVLVSHPKHLSGIKGLILPGGESTTMLKFLSEDNFGDAIKEFASAGRCLFGTCAGAILMAKRVINPAQSSLDLIDITIERNAYGRQLGSQVGFGQYLGEKHNQEMVFIRAPKITAIGSSVNIFATYQGLPVGVTQDNYMVTTFHPELTSDNTIHQLFIERCQRANC